MRSAARFGISVIIASLCSGCAVSMQANPYYMSIDQLNNFRTNCDLRDQQMALLMSQITTNRDEMAFSWRGVTGEARIVNDMINRLMVDLRDCR